MSDPTVSCPACGGKQPRRMQDSIYWCPKCRCQFDSEPDEGGDYSDHNAAARLEREERERSRARTNRKPR